MVTETMMPVNGIEVCVETFGEPTDPPLLLLAGDASSMDWWDDEFCRRLAAGGRFVVRYDHRDTGRSTCFPIGAPAYSGADLMDDALGVLDVLGLPAAHLVGFSLGGGIAQRIAVEHPARVLSLTLMATSAGYGDADPPPPHASPQPATPPVHASSPQPATPPVHASSPRTAAAVSLVTRTPPAADIDWTDRRTAVTGLIAEIRDRGGPFTAAEPQLRRLAERIFDRSADLAAGRHNHQRAGYGPPIRDRLGAIVAPTVVLHGTLDRRFPPEHPRELATAIPHARLVWLDGVGHEQPPRAVWETVLAEILSFHSTGRPPE
ncbi:alpha/beta hydrolase [Actinoplanes sp. NPDC023714]|uniref:alpha/beta fold hydrolase n=1 Tax=Actinoplanes sp. NPDC023714 TaxID=3154322 RepID=UPI0033D0DB4D